MNVAVLVLVGLTLALPVHAADVSQPVRVMALAVAETSQGFVGVGATVEAQVIHPGAGRVYVATKPLAQTDMQGSARLAAQVAASTLGLNWLEYDYLVHFASPSHVIGGPSAGAVMSLAIAVALHNAVAPHDPWNADPRVAATGTINPDGTIGPVGGVPAKAQGAARAGVTTFLYPAGLEQATTQIAGPFGPRWTTVDMATHCAALAIVCRPVTTLRELLAEAAGIRFDEPVLAVPDTGDYAAILGPGIEAEVEFLSSRLARAQTALAPLAPAWRAQVEPYLSDAAGRLNTAEESLASHAFYRAATEAFQGHIAVGRAENLTAFYAADRARSVVVEAHASCAAAAQASHEVDTLEVRGRNALFAIGAAQERAAHATELAATAQTYLENAVRYDDWVQSLLQSAFCAERARTVSWWAGLVEAFPAGPPLADLPAVAQAQVDHAVEVVTYAEAVLGSAGTARVALESAMRYVDATLWPAAVMAAVDAQTTALVAVQTGSGTSIPDTVLDAARQGAGKAILAARSQGTEPIASVSLVELADGQADPTARLANYWNARTLALLDIEPIPAAATRGPAPSGVDATESLGVTMALTMVGASVLATTACFLWALGLGRKHGPSH